MARAVQFDHYGPADVLHVVDVPTPVPDAREVVVEVRAAGINPGEIGIRSGAMHDTWPATFPSGQGSDLAGVVVAVAPDVSEFAVGDEVLGYSWRRSSHASHVAVPVDQIVRKPSSVPWEVAGALYVVGVTAYAAVRAIDPSPGETVAVSAAAGGVGTVVVQLLRARGARVLGIASPANDEWLTTHGATPVHYGDGLRDRLAAEAPDAFIDLFSPDYVRLALDLGIPADRINTAVSYQMKEDLGVKTEDSLDASTPEVLDELAGLVADGTLEIPIPATYPLEKVVDAFTELERRHTRGKIVLIP
ncbi:NADP-dependent oxidoreductase [Cryptosporangium phraense]|uniref:NADP-dependent oxidoreductase n=1 Tax=Cryptosporangium phraense TaxID=2593070 RepID=A0A545AQQ7_9ACTN|nr:NADP-dependent oxidoreductase [Cryptosporangium phraense]TQS43035.1 NADP-dependent oxidoreductase [Cryptosporangium phraense]